MRWAGRQKDNCVHSEQEQGQHGGRDMVSVPCGEGVTVSVPWGEGVTVSGPWGEGVTVRGTELLCLSSLKDLPCHSCGPSVETGAEGEFGHDLPFYHHTRPHRFSRDSKCPVLRGMQAAATRSSQHWVEGWPLQSYGWGPIQDYVTALRVSHLAWVL